ncbi:hypothetical protein BZA77DRAFT_329526 [Pyronema omphalodes]|nr:hypothetical protein BZA77DRAFT_329526 [Pyronema omphalodes]
MQPFFLVPIHSRLMSVLFVPFCPLFGHLNEHPSHDTLPVCAWIDLAALPPLSQILALSPTNPAGLQPIISCAQSPQPDRRHLFFVDTSLSRSSLIREKC